MNGKSKCRILKEIRKQIAAENNIAYVTSECKYQGDCTGTCPKCEAEVRYLEEQLRLRQKAGRAVAVAGIAAALLVTASGCDLIQDGPEPDVLTGDVPVVTEFTSGNTDSDVLPGRASLPTETERMGELAETEPELMGDIAVETEAPLPEEGV